MDFDEIEYDIISRKLGKSRVLTLPKYCIGKTIWLIWKK